MRDEASRRWLHELRNAVNTVCITSAVMKRMLADGKAEQAREFAGELDAACHRCRELMESPPGELKT